MKRLCAVLCVLALLFLCGCSSGEKGREPEGTVLVEVLGVDHVAGVYVLTAAGSDMEGTVVLQTVEGATVREVFERMPGAGEEWVSLTNVTHLLLGDGVEPGEVLTFILKDSGMSWRATVWYAPLAMELMTETADGGVARLTILEETGGCTVSVLDVLAELASDGAAELPALTLRGGVLEVVGKLCYTWSEKGARET